VNAATNLLYCYAQHAGGLPVVGAFFILLGLAAVTAWRRMSASLARRLPEFVRTLTGL
jgi:hypothetical protein